MLTGMTPPWNVPEVTPAWQLAHDDVTPAWLYAELLNFEPWAMLPTALKLPKLLLAPTWQPAQSNAAIPIWLVAGATMVMVAVLYIAAFAVLWH